MIHKTIIPTVITNDINVLKRKFTQIRSITEWMQIDIVDGKFANNTTIMPFEIDIDFGEVKVEVHLLTVDPENYIKDCASLPAQRIIFHLESTDNPVETINQIKKYGVEVGLALNPDTSVSEIEGYLNKVNIVTIMSVSPGFGGQRFIPETLEKIKTLRKISDFIKIEVDGGINLSNIEAISNAGTDYFVVGNAIFDSTDPKKALQQLSALL